MDEGGEAEEVYSGGIAILPDDDEDDEDEDEEMDRKLSHEEIAKKAQERRKKEDETPAPEIKRFKVTSQQEYNLLDGDVLTIREFDSPQCDGAVIFEGFPSKGMTSVVTAQFLIETLKLPLIGDIYSPNFPTSCRVRDGQSCNPTRIYGSKQLVVFFSEHTIDTEYVHYVAKAILEFALKHKCTKIFTAEGLADELQVPKELSQESIINLLAEAAKKTSLRESGDLSASMSKAKEAEAEDVLFVTNDAGFGTELRALGFHYVRNAIIGGVSGRLQAEAAVGYDGIIVTCLVARYNPLLSEANTPVVIVHALLKIFHQHFTLSTDKLEKKTKRLIKKISKAILEATSSKTRTHSSMYL